jgi:putative transcriptional regulator
MSRFGKKIIGRLKNFVGKAKGGKNLADSFTCHTVTLDLQPRVYRADDIAAVRKLLGASQAVFARFLGVSRNTVRSWEQGVNVPSPIACRFMDELRVNPQYWQERLRTSVKVKKRVTA